MKGSYGFGSIYRKIEARWRDTCHERRQVLRWFKQVSKGKLQVAICMHKEVAQYSPHKLSWL